MNIRKISTKISTRINFNDIILGLFIISIAILISFHSFARDDGQWSDAPSANRQWFSNLMQPDNPLVSCCGEADAFEADVFFERDGHYVAVITLGKGNVTEGTQIDVPNHKIKWDKGNPTGHGIVFIGPRREVYCYVAPAGG